MDSSSLQEVVQPLQRLSKSIDKKLPRLQNWMMQQSMPEKRKHNNSCQRRKKLQELHKHTDEILTDLRNEYSTVQKQSEVFSQLTQCMDTSLEFAKAYVSLLEAEFALKGYECASTHIKQDGNELLSGNNNNVPSKVAPLNLPMVDDESDKTYVVNIQAATPPDDGKKNEYASQQTGLYGILPSPQSPDILVPNKTLSEVSSPVLTNLTKDTATDKYNTEIEEERIYASQAYFSPVECSSKKGVKKELIGKSLPASSLFPMICSPQTPEFLSVCTPHPRDTKKEVEFKTFNAGSDVDEDDDKEELIMHSRRSFMLGNIQGGDSPEVTVNLLKSKQSVTPPVTPDFGEKFSHQSGAATFVKTSHSDFNTLHENPSFNSPESPNIVRPITAKIRSPPHLNINAFKVLPESFKRLLSFEQVNAALETIRAYADSKDDRILSLSDIEKTTNLRSKTKCCVLVLKTLGAIRKLPGTETYEILV